MFSNVGRAEIKHSFMKHVSLIPIKALRRSNNSNFLTHVLIVEDVARA